MPDLSFDNRNIVYIVYLEYKLCSTGLQEIKEYIFLTKKHCSQTVR